MEIQVKSDSKIGGLYCMAIDVNWEKLTPADIKGQEIEFHSSTFNFANASWCFKIFSLNKTFYLFTLRRLSSDVTSQTIIMNCLLLRRSKGKDRYISRKLAFTGQYDEYIHQDIFHFARQFCVLTCDVTQRVDATSQTKTYEDKKDSNLCQDLKKMLLNGQEHDLSLKVGDKEFRAHQNIMRCRSEVFDSMLSHDMIEKNSGVIDVPDCDPQAFEQFLVYVYSGEVQTLDQSNMLGLYYIADKYDMMHLKEECRKFIRESLSVTNICDVIQLSLKHSDSGLLEQATEYFVNNVKNILPTVEWQCFMKNYTTQANELFIKSTNKWYDPKV